MKLFSIISGLLITYLSFSWFVREFIGQNGVTGDWLETASPWLFVVYFCAMTHITITSMSLSFHRYHTHKGVILNKFLDTIMQLNLWLIGGMSKLDWVSVHIYHHAHSDEEKDPHSPVQKGLLHILFLGVFDYTKAKSDPEVLEIRKKLKRNKLEQFIADNTLLGVSLMTTLNILLFGPFFGTIISLLNFSISPIFAVGGVNGFAHWWGYKNHPFKDNSRNLGFLFPLNFLICGELDHNNHHAHPRSCSFRHRWFELDWGFMYIHLFKWMKLAKIKSAYTPKTLRRELSIKLTLLMDKDFRFKNRLEELSAELNTNYNDLLENIKDYIEGRKVDLSHEVRLLVSEVKRTFYMNGHLNLRYQ